jgi:hypothetical protein
VIAVKAMENNNRAAPEARPGYRKHTIKPGLHQGRVTPLVTVPVL